MATTASEVQLPALRHRGLRRAVGALEGPGVPLGQLHHGLFAEGVPAGHQHRRVLLAGRLPGDGAHEDGVELELLAQIDGHRQLLHGLPLLFLAGHHAGELQQRRQGLHAGGHGDGQRALAGLPQEPAELPRELIGGGLPEGRREELRVGGLVQPVRPQEARHQLLDLRHVQRGERGEVAPGISQRPDSVSVLQHLHELKAVKLQLEVGAVVQQKTVSLSGDPAQGGLQVPGPHRLQDGVHLEEGGL